MSEEDKNDENDVAEDTYMLYLYVAGQTPGSIRAIGNLKRICEQYLGRRYKLEVIDLYQQPQLAKENQIIAIPTLIKRMPPPIRRIIGDLSNSEKVIRGLDIVQD